MTDADHDPGDCPDCDLAVRNAARIMARVDVNDLGRVARVLDPVISGAPKALGYYLAATLFTIASEGLGDEDMQNMMNAVGCIVAGLRAREATPAPSMH